MACQWTFARSVLHVCSRLPTWRAFTERPAGKLSGGMKQKLGLACTLVRSPELLLLDEPSVGVDPLSRRDLWIIIEQLVRGGELECHPSVRRIWMKLSAAIRFM